MAQLAIKGHSTKGKEVIEILGMLGGSNVFGHVGNNTLAMYCIDETYKNFIICYGAKRDCGYIIFTLEEFLEMFPYKVGDKVQHKWATSCGSVYEVEKTRWVDDHVEYAVKRLWCWNDHYTFTAEDLQPFEEENMEERKHADLRLDVDQDDKLATEVTIDGVKISSPENYLIGKITQVDNSMLVEFVKKETMEEQKAIPPYMDYDVRTEKDMEEKLLNAETYFKIWNKTDNGYEVVVNDNYELKQIDNHFYIKKKQPQYPKTYEECCQVLRLNKSNYITGYREGLLTAFHQLLICRDTYWKIAGNWKPYFGETFIYAIGTCYGVVEKRMVTGSSCILLFPTEEMRDTFYENFKELIESCKELL